jgi:hypothetical protein
MTDMKTKAQEVLYAYMDVEKDLSQPKILIYTLKELINQLQVSPGMIRCFDIIKLCEELEKTMTEPTMKNNTKRAIGTTTGLMLQTLGKAVENPGEEVEFIDHHKQKHAQLQLYKTKIELFAKALNLDVSVDLRLKENCVDYGLFVKSNWVSPYSQRTPAEEKWKELYGFYPAKRYDAERWEYFQQGFESAK